MIRRVHMNPSTICFSKPQVTTVSQRFRRALQTIPLHNKNRTHLGFPCLYLIIVYRLISQFTTTRFTTRRNIGEIGAPNICSGCAALCDIPSTLICNNNDNGAGPYVCKIPSEICCAIWLAWGRAEASIPQSAWWNIQVGNRTSAS